MSNYRKGDWTAVWDALFWNFMNRQRAFFLSNPRLGMLLKTYDKMSEERKKEIEEIAGRSM
jgi:deoxyribodipyrimidine photolyase-related protein